MTDKYFLLSTFSIPAGILVNVRPVALMEMTDSGESDYKIIAVPVDDRRWEDIKDLEDLNKHSLKEFTHFFETSKTLKAKPAVLTIHGYKGKKEAMETIQKARELYNQKFGK